MAPVTAEMLLLPFKALPRAISYGKEYYGYKKDAVLEERNEQTYIRCALRRENN